MYSRFFTFSLIIVEGTNLQGCLVDENCICQSSIATGILECSQCQYEADPTRQQELQAGIDGYLIRHAAVGSMTLSATGAPSSTSSVRSASLISSPAITSIPSTVAAASRSASSQASATSVPTGNGNGASSVAVQMTGAVVAAGVAAALAVL
ncbi:hypothetical protein FRC00_001354 [Tulasnella sp. 408]|nr:hypothetical protein FRC00_001354 [Tulasnella sp. 408]